jgi:hypothetical protein
LLGFYRVENETQLVYSAGGPSGPGYNLSIDERLTYVYPIDGWRLFDDEAQARTFFGLPPLPLDWAPATTFAEGDKVRRENGQLFLVVTAGTTSEYGPAQNAQLYPDGSVQFAYIGNFN